MKFEDLIKSTKLDFYQDEDKNKIVLEDIRLKLIPENLRINFYRVNFSYKTIRGNKKENNKYIIANDKDDAIFKFLEYINKFNKEYSFRPYLNVKILKCVEEGNVKILIE